MTKEIVILVVIFSIVIFGIFKNKNSKHGHTMHKEGTGSDNAEAKETKKVNIQKAKKMKKDVPNLPKSSMLQSPAGKAVKKVAKKAAVKMVKKAAKKMKY
jgi:hypothetical protein